LAFYKCRSLYYIDISGAYRIGRRAFGSCDNLRDVRFGEDLTYISDYAFENCESLYSIRIPQSVDYIGRYAFWMCENLGVLEIDNAEAEIGAHAFEGCRNMYEATLGENITAI
jgi:hypothetical protein